MTKNRVTIPAKIRSFIAVGQLKLGDQSSVQPGIASSCTKIGRRLSSVLAETRIKRAPDKEDPNDDSYGKEWAHDS
jgi:hypothetical protein